MRYETQHHIRYLFNFTKLDRISSSLRWKHKNQHHIRYLFNFTKGDRTTRSSDRTVSPRGWLNSLLSCGVGSMYQPMPLASWSMRRVPPLGRPKGSNWVMVASASCPVGRSLTTSLKSKKVSKSTSLFQILSTLLLYG